MIPWIHINFVVWMVNNVTRELFSRQNKYKSMNFENMDLFSAPTDTVSANQLQPLTTTSTSSTSITEFLSGSHLQSKQSKTSFKASPKVIWPVTILIVVGAIVGILLGLLLPKAKSSSYSPLVPSPTPNINGLNFRNISNEAILFQELLRIFDGITKDSAFNLRGNIANSTCLAFGGQNSESSMYIINYKTGLVIGPSSIVSALFEKLQTRTQWVSYLYNPEYEYDRTGLLYLIASTLVDTDPWLQAAISVSPEVPFSGLALGLSWPNVNLSNPLMFVTPYWSLLNTFNNAALCCPVQNGNNFQLTIQSLQHTYTNLTQNIPNVFDMSDIICMLSSTYQNELTIVFATTQNSLEYIILTSLTTPSSFLTLKVDQNKYGTLLYADMTYDGKSLIALTSTTLLLYTFTTNVFSLSDSITLSNSSGSVVCALDRFANFSSRTENVWCTIGTNQSNAFIIPFSQAIFNASQAYSIALTTVNDSSSAAILVGLFSDTTLVLSFGDIYGKQAVISIDISNL